jgi:hypothetical protein
MLDSRLPPHKIDDVVVGPGSAGCHALSPASGPFHSDDSQNDRSSSSSRHESIVQNHIVLLVDLVQRTAVGLMVPLRTPATSSRFKILPLAVMGKLDNGNRYSGMLYLDNA